MKNKFIKYCLLSTILILSVGCFSDKGNYDYHDINEVTISNIEKDYSVFQGIGTLHIEPKLDGTIFKENTENYSYTWNIDEKIISKEKVLNFQVDLELGTYYLYFRVMDNSSGVEWKTFTKISVSSPSTRGFILACEDKEGYLQMDMIGMPKGEDTLILKNLLKNSDIPKMKGARKIVHTGQIGSPEFIRVWVIGGDGSYFVNPNTFEGNVSNSLLSQLFTSLPIPEQLYPIDIAGYTSNGYGQNSRTFLCNNGWVFTASIYSEEAYGNPVNYVKKETTKPFNTAPYLMYQGGYFNGALMLYDKDGERFVKVGSFDDFSTALVDKAEEAFPWNNKKSERTLMYAENTRNSDGSSRNGNSFAIMMNKDKTQFWIYKFLASGSKRDGYTVLPMANGIANASLFAFASNRTLMFYAVGSKLYAYDYNKTNEKIYELNIGNGNDEITMIKFDLQSENVTYNDLYIGTHNETTGGTLRKVTLDTTDPNTVTLIKDENAVWTGLAKIKNMDWRNY